MKILVTGANGYIGTRLIPLLAEAGHEVIAVVRSRKRIQIPKVIQEHVKVVEADLLAPETLDKLPKDIDAAYYLVHSMSQSKKSFHQLEESCAVNFINYLRQTTAKHLIYLSGLTQDQTLSKHLASRRKVEDILKQTQVPCTILRAGIIIGSGSGSFEIIRDLVEKLPIMIAPRWVNNRTQPIAIRDVLFYLQAVLDHNACKNQTFSISGPEIMTYKEMMEQLAEERKLRRLIITVPVLTPKLSSYWLFFVTSTDFSLASTLVESLKNETYSTENPISEVIEHQCLKYDEAIKKAFTKIEQNAIVSSWKDAIVKSSLPPKLKDFIQVPEHGCLKDVTQISLYASKTAVIEKLWAIGGKNGWYYANWAWRFRGFIDKLFGGVGLSRGRTLPSEIKPGGVLDFWRVLLADKEAGHLLLYAEMKLPGEAWLEFRVQDKKLTQTATFRPKGVLGRIYWYGLLPIHHFIFKGMAREIAKGIKQ